MIQLRQMNLDDIPLGMRLKGVAGWNQTPVDWRRFLSLQPGGCFVAEWDGVPVATTATCVFGPIGWIAMVLVDPAYRGRGIASQLMQFALGYLEVAGVKTVRLDATPLGRPVYERLGFEAEYELERLELAEGTPAATGQDAYKLAACTPAAWELDWQATATRREQLLTSLLAANPSRCRMIADGQDVCGYLLVREGSRALQIGPCIASQAQAGRRLCDEALSRAGQRPVFIDIPLDNQEAMAWAKSRGFQSQRRLTRMRRGQPVADRPTWIWASSGPELG